MVGSIIDTIYGYFSALFGWLSGLKQVLQWLEQIGQKIVAWLGTVWQYIVKHIIGGILQALSSLGQWLDKVLQPVLQFLQRLRQILASYYNTYLRPIMTVIQRIRQYTQILAMLHIKIAQKLDAYLGDLQARILGAFYTITGAINTLTQILLALQDPTYLIKHPVLIVSIRRQVPALIRVLTGQPPGYWFPSPKGAAGGVWAPPAVPLNFTDPTQNPLASSLLGNDGLPADLSPLVNCYEYMETSVDALAPIDYFNQALYPQTLCPYDDPAKCLLYSWGLSVN